MYGLVGRYQHHTLQGRTLPAPHTPGEDATSTTHSRGGCYQHYTLQGRMLPALHTPGEDATSTTHSGGGRYQHHTLQGRTLPAPHTPGEDAVDRGTHTVHVPYCVYEAHCHQDNIIVKITPSSRPHCHQDHIIIKTTSSSTKPSLNTDEHCRMHGWWGGTI